MKKQITWKITLKRGKEKLGKGRLFDLEQYTKYTRLWKSTNLYLQKDPVHLNWKDVLLVVEVLTWLSPP